MQVLAALRENVAAGEGDAVCRLAQEALGIGMDAMQAINEGLIPGITEAGVRFERKEYFLPELILSADAMKNGMDVLEAAVVAGGIRRNVLATVVLGTVKGDIHDIGKSIVGALLSAHGFHVIDLGVDVAADTFVDRVRKSDAQMLAMSALLPTTMPYMKRVIDELGRHGLRDKVKVIVGGAPVTAAYAQQIGADGYGDDAIAAVRVARSVLGLHA
jgi:5-methyltetrahydrofolate--homocysteine methyltransferase